MNNIELVPERTPDGHVVLRAEVRTPRDRLLRLLRRLLPALRAR